MVRQRVVSSSIDRSIDRRVLIDKFLIIDNDETFDDFCRPVWRQIDFRESYCEIIPSIVNSRFQQQKNGNRNYRTNERVKCRRGKITRVKPILDGK